MAKLHKVTLYIAGRDGGPVHGDVDPIAQLNGDLYHAPVQYEITDVESVDVGGPYDHDDHPLNKTKTWNDIKGFYESHK